MASLPGNLDDAAAEDRTPSWAGLRIGVPIAIILIGIALASLWDSHARLLASGDVTIGRQEFRLQLRDDRGDLSGHAISPRGGMLIQHIASLGGQPVKPAGSPSLNREEVRKARLVVDRRRQEARFLLPQGAIVFDGRKFTFRRLEHRPAALP